MSDLPSPIPQLRIEFYIADSQKAEVMTDILLEQGIPAVRYDTKESSGASGDTFVIYSSEADKQSLLVSLSGAFAAVDLAKVPVTVIPVERFEI